MTEALRAIAWCFVHPEERRLRAGLRIVVLAIVIAMAAIPAMIAAMILRLASITAALTLNFVVLVPSILLVALVVDRRRIADLGVPTTPRAALGLVWGGALGSGLIGGIALIESAFGWADYAWLGPTPSTLALSIALFAMVAVHEGLFRGYLLTNLAEGIGGRPSTRVRGLAAATLLTSFGFALAHLFNPSPSLLAMTNVGLAGVFLATPFVLRGDLGGSIGLHFGWNLTQCWLGMAVSGNQVQGAWVARTLAPGHELWTGGAFGAEGGLLGSIAVIVGTVLAIPLARWLRDPERSEAMGLAPASRRAMSKAGPPASAEAPPLRG